MMTNTVRCLTILLLTFLGISLLIQIINVRGVLADWDPTGETTVATYEVIPEEEKIHVTLSYQLKNLDEELKGTRRYYSGWTVSAPLEATNIQIYDQNEPLSFDTEIVESRIHLKLQFNKRLKYGMEYAFSIEYDLRIITRNVAIFTAQGKGNGASTVKVLLPRGYYDHVQLEPSSHTISETETHTIYSYNIDRDGWTLYTQVSAAAKTNYHSLSDTVKLPEREVDLVVEFWEGEEAKAQHILSLYIAALPILEDITSVAYPGPDQIVVREVTTEDTGGYGGLNMGEEGIVIAYKNMERDRVLVHELAHYWAGWPYWKEDWTVEGYAQLYAHLTTIKLDKEITAEEIIESRTSNYEANKDQFDMPLSLWSTPEVRTEENWPETYFGYSKSFVFVFNLYDEYGANVIQKANQEVYEGNREGDWFDYLFVLENITGEELGPIFSEWVLPDEFTNAFSDWQSAENLYWESNQSITERKGALGIAIVEIDLNKSKELIMSGDFNQALSQIQSTTSLFEKWVNVEKAYSEAEQSVAESKDALGIGIVKTELDKSKDFIMNGDFNQALNQLQLTAVLFQEWEAAETAIRDAEQAIARAKMERRTWRLSNIEQTINKAKTLIEEGRLEESLSKSQLAREKAINNPTPQLAIPVLWAPYFSDVASLAYWVFGLMAAVVLAFLTLAVLDSAKVPKISRDGFRRTFRRSLKISPLAFALILGLVEYLDKGQIGTAIGLTVAGAFLGLGSVLLGFWLLLLVRLLPLRTEFSKDIVYGISGSILGAFVLGLILDIPFIAGLILGFFSSVVISSVKTCVRNLFGLSRNQGS